MERELTQPSTGRANDKPPKNYHELIDEKDSEEMDQVDEFGENSLEEDSTDPPNYPSGQNESYGGGYVAHGGRQISTIDS